MCAGAAELAGVCGRGGWCSQPVAGKHLAFDGRLLHGAPPELAVRPAVGGVRVTLLVNVWLGSVPASLAPLPAWSAAPPALRPRAVLPRKTQGM